MNTLGNREVLRNVSIPRISFFSKEEYTGRLQRVRERMATHGIDLLMLTSSESIRYFTGFYTVHNILAAVMPPQFLLVPAEGEMVHLLRYMEIFLSQVYSVVKPENVVFYDDTEDYLDVVTEQVRRMGHDKSVIGREGRNIVDVTLHRLRHEEHQRLHTASWRHLDGDLWESIVESVRDVKSSAELECMRNAGKQGLEALRAGHEAIRPGTTDNNVAAEIAATLLREGSEPLPHSPTVTSGWRSGIPHTTFERTGIEEADTVLLEFSGVYAGYVAPIMRTAFVGQPTAKAREMADVLMDALHGALGVMKAGVTSGDVDQACRSVIERAGYFENFRKRTGYSVGMSWPGHLSLAKDDPTVLKPGMTFHLPLALRDYGRCVVGFSPTVAVTDEGYEVLTDLPCGLDVISA